MKETSIFPKWFKDVLFGIGALYVFQIIRNAFAKDVPLFALSYPIILFIILQYEKNPEGKGKSGKGEYFLSISLFIISIFTLILLIIKNILIMLEA